MVYIMEFYVLLERWSVCAYDAQQYNIVWTMRKVWVMHYERLVSVIIFKMKRRLYGKWRVCGSKSCENGNVVHIDSVCWVMFLISRWSWENCEYIIWWIHGEFSIIPCHLFQISRKLISYYKLLIAILTYKFYVGVKNQIFTSSPHAFFMDVKRKLIR